MRFSQAKPAPTEFLADLREITVELSSRLSREERRDLEARAVSDPDGWYKAAMAADWLRAASGDPERIILQGLDQAAAQAVLDAISESHQTRVRQLPAGVASFPMNRWIKSSIEELLEESEGMPVPCGGNNGSGKRRPRFGVARLSQLLRRVLLRGLEKVDPS